jgi:hypothetical protein
MKLIDQKVYRIVQLPNMLNALPNKTTNQCYYSVEVKPRRDKSYYPVGCIVDSIEEAKGFIKRALAGEIRMYPESTRVMLRYGEFDYD